MEKLTSKGKHRVKVGSHPHTNMKSKPATVRRGEYKRRTLEMHLKLRDQQLKTILFVYRLLYQNLMVTTKRKYDHPNVWDEANATLKGELCEERSQREISPSSRRKSG